MVLLWRVLFLLLLSTSLAPVRAAMPDYAHAASMHHLLHWSRLPVRVLFLPGLLLTDEHKKAVLAGFDRWTLVTGGRISYKVVDSIKDADITVDFDPHPNLPGMGNATGDTLMTYAGAVLQKAQMMLATGSMEDVDLSNAAAHEFGHALGIDGHSDSRDDLMYPEITRMIWLVQPALPSLPRLPSARDVNTLKLCYPALLTDTPNAGSR